ncbi:hypothetical protein SDRG_05243 [Saprolegnia diclina VS20]|uniref:Uncharacterized protein n=1 Tax=Saprolegnia diclina (strain VS20) TaxID=1156394 RepID=T0QUG1_SAPDV|nr:hypothetical protein SDRG_05243 [Saprolegnia diclina VS20]EQC37655.1 hypothetical protein SDRG_05243 [Saprolegnia diclina VS20]|eukprot:XP_008609175.1 hypothetical protein SDRG_05243 [Saprolegnia diclina VS20]
MKTHCLLLIALAASADGLSTLYGTCPVTSPASASPCVLGANGSVEATYAVDSNRRFVVQGAGIDVVQSLPATATSINLMMNEITSVGLSPSSAVQALNLSYNRVASLDAIASLPTLQSLDLSYNNISDASTLSAQLARFPNLASLSLRGNRISSIQNLKVPPSLQALDLSGNIITTFDVTVATYYALAALTTLNLRGVYITSCAGQVVMLRQAAVCITDAPGPSMLRSMYGPIFVFFGTVLALLVVYLVGKRLLLGPPALTDHTLRATCVSSGYSRMDDDPVEYRISVSLDLDTSDLTSRLRNDEALTTAHKLHLKDIRKLKLISATPLYTTICIRTQGHLATAVEEDVLGVEKNVRSRLSAFQNLRVLNLSNNQLRSIRNPTFPASLQSLDLSGNVISVFDVSTATYKALVALPRLTLGTVALTSCSGQLMMLGRAVVCVTDANATLSFFGSLYGPLVLVFGGFTTISLAYLIFFRDRESSATERRDPALRATCISSGYSRMDDDPVEYRISVSLDLDTSDLTSRLRNDDALTPAHKLHLKDIRKLKLISATPLYTTYRTFHCAHSVRRLLLK